MAHLGDLPGLRWCPESRRYFSVSTPQQGMEWSGETYSVSNARTNAYSEVLQAPVSLRIVETFPRASKRSRAYSEDCSICLKSGVTHKTDPRMRFVQLPCKHSFHLYCIEEWLVKRSGSCPNCRCAVDVALGVSASTIC